MTTAHLDPEALREAAATAVAALKLLANEDRLLLLCALSQQEFCVSELEERLGIRQPTLSQQLGVLRNEEVVTVRKSGKHVYYRIADPHLVTLLHTLYALYCPKDPS
ncbi:ArsR/SmtB family transcription factor [Roseateles amylovorans]|jgi:DNA-binding transcriptional ArsR family regulator|uniref:Metalloregulator ArsR/SmtB family transcription factor n=1 Tax=Roseateles amylovorans TaxID=2978473 RepID=A0ABY6AW45_9BURK|nr:metalloregulator ArsR/SmtB family transcription factor [Roseateles amylovorans]UXH77396.1 metalloregulator ArsR/SmtB family transcription factor [Roseateles amylovorans]